MLQGGGRNADGDSIALLEATAEPAFACGDDGRILAWNAGIEHLLGYSAERVLGTLCWNTLHGHDVFGNPCCHEFCSVQQALIRNEAVHGFEMDLRKASGGIVRVLCSTLVVRGGRGARHIKIHLLRPTSASDLAVHQDGEMKGRPGQAIPVAWRGAGGSDGCPKFTARQIEVLSSLGDGLDSRAVAKTLGISVLTVRTHTRNILHRCAVHNIRQAISLARRHGLI